MVDWSSPAEIAYDSTVYTRLMFVLFGVYIWEIVVTFGFEWSLITGKRRFTWPLSASAYSNAPTHADHLFAPVFYFLCRYCLLGALVGLIVSLTVTTVVNCQSLYTFNSWAGNMAIVCASTCLMLRTIAIWERKLKVVIPLCIFSLAHWVVLWRGAFTLTAVYSTQEQACVLTSNNHVYLNVEFLITMAFDFVTLVFTLVALIPKKSRSDLWTLLFRDGLVYFIVAFCFNALPAILNILNLNVMMNVIAAVPAAVISAMAACRAVVRLHEYRSGGVYVDSSAMGQGSSSNGPGARRPTVARRRSLAFARPEVLVTTDQFVMQDFGAAGDGTKANKVDLKREDSLEDKYGNGDRKAYDVAHVV
ncbi:uncharacterized protein FIBRA_04943 [Fibroporia radiculosa]|uniref:Uncharacterized protein n=1 Tax=Fibroporia radiculosa TaxID=599839 RepID=J4IAF7_9APHY|nr:uncharacterized protein FIBRA_04943 [Fibroporia radiculosa]CCM02831.1 predicted protein [Fibroporia radiculosa]